MDPLQDIRKKTLHKQLQYMRIHEDNFYENMTNEEMNLEYARISEKPQGMKIAGLAHFTRISLFI